MRLVGSPSGSTRAAESSPSSRNGSVSASTLDLPVPLLPRSRRCPSRNLNSAWSYRNRSTSPSRIGCQRVRVGRGRSDSIMLVLQRDLDHGGPILEAGHGGARHHTFRADAYQAETSQTVDCRRAQVHLGARITRALAPV